MLFESHKTMKAYYVSFTVLINLTAKGPVNVLGKNTGWNYLQQFQTANIPRVILISNSLGVTKSIIAEQTNARKCC